MIQSLRKGRTSVYFKHADTGHSIGAEKYECEVRDSEAIIRFSLRPVSGSQTQDEEYSQTHPLQYVEIDDAYVIEGLRSYFEHHTQEFSAGRLEVLSRGQRLSFRVTPNMLPHRTLRLVVAANGG